MTPPSTPASDGRELPDATQGRRPVRSRMTAAERREQLIGTARGLFAERGFDGTSVEEVAARAGVSKPVVYEHFGGKEGLYAVVVDREVRTLLTLMQQSLTAGHPRVLLEQATLALLDYIEQSSDGFRILVRDSPIGSASGSFVSIIGDVASRVEHILAAEFTARGLDDRGRTAVRPDAGRHGRYDGPVVARRPAAVQGRRRGPPGEPGLARAGRAAADADAALAHPVAGPAPAS